MTITVIERPNGGITIKGDAEDQLDVQKLNAIMEEAQAITHDHLPYQSMSLGFDPHEIISSIQVTAQAVREAVKQMAKQAGHYAQGGVIMGPMVPHMEHVHYAPPMRPEPYEKGMINDDVQALVILLGAMDCDEIVGWLRERGHTGIPADGWDCPMAHAIFAETGQRVVVSRTMIYARDSQIDTPPSIREFIELFDRGRFSDLITGNHRDYRGKEFNAGVVAFPSLMAEPF